MHPGLLQQLDDLRQQVLEESGGPIQRVERMAGVVRVVHHDELPAEMAWHTIESPRRLRRVIQLHDSVAVKHFLSELIDYETGSHHNGTIMLDGTRVTIEVYTHDIDDITEADRVYAKIVDAIYADALELYNRRNTLASGGCGIW
jgi:pterin-4a-carbinolamine dehydratase